MARYIDADTMIADLAKLENEYLYANGDTEKYEFVYGTLTGVRQAITYAKAQPTADVAPKSEVAREIIDDIEMYVLGIKSGKEIIEKTTPRIYRLKRKDYMEAVLEYLAELKKKYTEGKK